jgi:hypothetical protein
VRVQSQQPFLQIARSNQTSSPNHFPTSHQPQPSAISLKMVGKLVPKELHFGNPFPLAFCYPVLIIASYCFEVFMFNHSALILAYLASWRLNLYSLSHFRRIAPVNPLRRHGNLHAVALRERFAALVSFQRKQPGQPPHKSVNSANSSLRAACHFGG